MRRDLAGCQRQREAAGLLVDAEGRQLAELYGLDGVEGEPRRAGGLGAYRVEVEQPHVGAGGQGFRVAVDGDDARGFSHDDRGVGFYRLAAREQQYEREEQGEGAFHRTSAPFPLCTAYNETAESLRIKQSPAVPGGSSLRSKGQCGASARNQP